MCKLRPGGGITPTAAREAAPSASPTAGAGLEAMELKGNVVLIYTRLLSFYKTVAIYEKSLLS